MEDFRIDGDMIISKTLTNTDANHHGRLYLPKNQVFSVFRKMQNVTNETLQKGIEVEVVDIINNHSYFSSLRYRSTSTGDDYFLGSGWSKIMRSLNLKAGDIIKLYWDYLNYKFIILNFEYSLIP